MCLCIIGEDGCGGEGGGETTTNPRPALTLGGGGGGGGGGTASPRPLLPTAPCVGGGIAYGVPRITIHFKLPLMHMS